MGLGHCLQWGVEDFAQVYVCPFSGGKNQLEKGVGEFIGWSGGDSAEICNNIGSLGNIKNPDLRMGKGMVHPDDRGGQ
jgi:hypothetical protein